MAETIEHMEKEIELEEKKTNFLADKTGISIEKVKNRRRKQTELKIWIKRRIN